MIKAVRRRVVGLLSSPGEELGRWGKFLKFQIQLWLFCARRLRVNNAAAMSAALSFRTIFALVPLGVLLLLVLKSMGSFGDYRQSLRNFFTNSGLSQIELRASSSPATEADTQPAEEEADPDERINLAEQIESLVDRLESQVTFGRVGPVGLALLVWSVLTLLTTVERSLNRVFQAERSRSLVRRTVIYWTAISLGPVAMTAASYAGQRLMTAVEGSPRLSWLLGPVGWGGPIVTGMVLLAALYKLMPNTHVRNRAAIGGAVIAVPLWLLAKWGFAVYVRELVGTGNVYGALGLLPLFLIWVNLSWLIFLFGAELAHTAASLSRLDLAERAERILLGPWESLAAAVAVCRRFTAGGGPASLEEIASDLGLPEISAQRLVDGLVAGGVLCPAEKRGESGYLPARPADTIRVRDILAGAGGEPPLSPAAEGVARTIREVRGRAEGALGDLTLARAAEMSEGR